MCVHKCACVCWGSCITEKWNFHNQTETLFTKWELVFLKNKTQTKHKHTPQPSKEPREE